MPGFPREWSHGKCISDLYIWWTNLVFLVFDEVLKYAYIHAYFCLNKETQTFQSVFVAFTSIDIFYCRLLIILFEISNNDYQDQLATSGNFFWYCIVIGRYVMKSLHQMHKWQSSAQLVKQTKSNLFFYQSEPINVRPCLELEIVISSHLWKIQGKIPAVWYQNM